MNSLYTDLRAEYLTEWRVWYRMNHSCEQDQPYYVEVNVCDEWKGQEGFIAWFDHVGPRPTNRSVFDRINKFGDYEPGNVRWTTKDENLNNGRKHQTPGTLSYWSKQARKNGIKKQTFYRRVHDYGWNIEDAATMPTSQVRYRNRTV